MLDWIDAKDDLLHEHRTTVPDVKHTKKGETKDLLMIFSDQVHVKFIKPNGSVEEVAGRWCNVCK